MPKPSKPRTVSFLPHVRYFLPLGVPDTNLEEELLNLEEVEAIRLSDLEKFPQSVCAEKMGIAQSTFNRLIDAARSKLARSIVEGRAIAIRGGNIELTSNRLRCMACGHEWLQPDSADSDTASPESCPRCEAGPLAVVIPSRPKTIGSGVYRYGLKNK